MEFIICPIFVSSAVYYHSQVASSPFQGLLLALLRFPTGDRSSAGEHPVVPQVCSRNGVLQRWYQSRLEDRLVKW